MAEYKGIIRSVDRLGRVVIPKELRKQLDIKDGEDALEMRLTEKGELVLKKHQPNCIFCGAESFLLPFKESLI